MSHPKSSTPSPSGLNRRAFLAAQTLAIGAAAGSTLVTKPAAAKPEPAPEVSSLYGPPPGVAKLNANENPFGPSKAALAAMNEAAQRGAYYVGHSVPRLKAMIAERHGVKPSNISLSAGSSGVLSYLAVAKAQSGHTLGPDLFWDTTAKAGLTYGGEIQRTPKTESLAIDLGAMKQAITENTSLIHITNPNNPTGLLLDGKELREFCKSASQSATVLVDEAYNELTEKPDFNSMVPLIKAGYDVMVARTFSKIYGLAGMRVGYMIASEENIDMLNRYGLGDYAMNQAGVAAAIASYNDEKFIAMSKSKIIEARESVIAATKSLGLNALPSETNFVFVDLGDMNANAFRQAMQGHNVLIRGVYRDYHNWSRVSMGYPEHVNQYIAALPQVMDTLASGAA